jgi:hypothetical protein
MSQTPAPDASTPHSPPTARELALLAARAAVALERSANAHNAQWAVVQSLADCLEQAFPPDPGEAGAVRQFAMTGAADVVDRALAFLGDSKPESLAELKVETDRLAAALRQASATTPSVELQDLRDRCIALARAAQSRDPALIYVRPGSGAQR